MSANNLCWRAGTVLTERQDDTIHKPTPNNMYSNSHFRVHQRYGQCTGPHAHCWWPCANCRLRCAQCREACAQCRKAVRPVQEPHSQCKAARPLQECVVNAGRAVSARFFSQCREFLRISQVRAAGLKFQPARTSMNSCPVLVRSKQHF